MVNLDVVGDGDSVERVWNGQDARVFPRKITTAKNSSLYLP